MSKIKITPAPVRELVVVYNNVERAFPLCPVPDWCTETQRLFVKHPREGVLATFREWDYWFFRTPQVELEPEA